MTTSSWTYILPVVGAILTALTVAGLDCALLVHDMEWIVLAIK